MNYHAPDFLLVDLRTGQYSPVTAGLSVLGNSIRIFTTLTLTKDPLLLLGFVLGFCLNAALLGQILFYS